jgi:hypothetical protein
MLLLVQEEDLVEKEWEDLIEYEEQENNDKNSN